MFHCLPSNITQCAISTFGSEWKLEQSNWATDGENISSFQRWHFLCEPLLVGEENTRKKQNELSNESRCANIHKRSLGLFQLPQRNTHSGSFLAYFQHRSVEKSKFINVRLQFFFQLYTSLISMCFHSFAPLFALLPIPPCVNTLYRMCMCMCDCLPFFLFGYLWNWARSLLYSQLVTVEFVHKLEC